MSNQKKQKLRLVTYMCPSHPVEMYELIMTYLERYTGLEATLQYESRRAGPLPGRVDPFTDDTVDIGFMSVLSFLELLDDKNKYAELLPVTPVFRHRKNKDDVAGYYSDIIIHINGKKHVKELLDLRGSAWAYSTEESLSGYKIVLKTLKEHGENSTFFGNTLQSGSHLQSIQMVLTKQAEAAAVDSNTLAYNKRYLQDQGKDVLVLDSIGPLPPYPIVVNSRMDGELKETIVRALKSFDKSEIWQTKFAQYGIQKFVTNHVDSYDKLRTVTEYIRDLNHAIRYY
ncbi:uncharacterized protein LOC126250043 [Schistocerca nitens]|uniref:uncharacterized protein LOC126250043 n=1 Tax=Schistocerca nitens TaxID=7011 RepID=UPI00211932CB|nr:uncharacterized protein LOC126250043 [Schistocerca nitens]XP_049807483.1 uncharacterized protein LOC126250043 [Schistocerca nitens]XP_049807484.1 uncharacterized protein LOC126250043 [Schistocerca nitens]